MSEVPNKFLAEHIQLSRRWFLRTGAAGAVALDASALLGREPQSDVLKKAVAKIEPYMTPQDDFGDVSRGDPIPHYLSPEKLAEVGQSRDTWKLEVTSDPENPARIKKPMTKEDGTAFDFKALLKLAETKAVRFPKVMTCLNAWFPLGMGIWEGVPMRDVIWQTEPQRNLRRVFYYGYHNDKPKQMFRSSLPVGRVLEDAFGLPPVILCYKLNGQWLTAERGGPVRVVVPEAYGFKSVKWLSNIVLSNLHNANDTYARGNNDVDSHLKTFAGAFDFPLTVKPNTPFAVTGYAQVGVSGLNKVQVWTQRKDDPPPAGDKYFTKAPWADAQILKPPTVWGGGLTGDKIPDNTAGFESGTGKPLSWPMRLTRVHWAYLHPGLPEGEHYLRSRTIDSNDVAQPMPRPFRKSGHASIEKEIIRVKA